MKKISGLVCAVAVVVFCFEQATRNRERSRSILRPFSPQCGRRSDGGFFDPNIESFSITGKPTGWSDPVIDAANRTITVVSPEKFDDDNDAVKSGSVTLTGKVHGGSTASATLRWCGRLPRI